MHAYLLFITYLIILHMHKSSAPPPKKEISLTLAIINPTGVTFIDTKCLTPIPSPLPVFQPLPLPRRSFLLAMKGNTCNAGYLVLVPMHSYFNHLFHKEKNVF